MTALFASLAQASLELCAHYSEEELSILLRFIKDSSQMMYEETEKLRLQVEGKLVN
jgi:hypothetical protein